eukprot:g933.t1
MGITDMSIATAQSLLQSSGGDVNGAVMVYYADETGGGGGGGGGGGFSFGGDDEREEEEEEDNEEEEDEEGGEEDEGSMEDMMSSPSSGFMSQMFEEMTRNISSEREEISEYMRRESERDNSEDDSRSPHFFPSRIRRQAAEIKMMIERNERRGNRTWKSIPARDLDSQKKKNRGRHPELFWEWYRKIRTRDPSAPIPLRVLSSSTSDFATRAPAPYRLRKMMSKLGAASSQRDFRTRVVRGGPALNVLGNDAYEQTGDFRIPALLRDIGSQKYGESDESPLLIDAKRRRRRFEIMVSNVRDDGAGKEEKKDVSNVVITRENLDTVELSADTKTLLDMANRAAANTPWQLCGARITIMPNVKCDVSGYDAVKSKWRVSYNIEASKVFVADHLNASEGEKHFIGTNPFGGNVLYQSITRTRALAVGPKSLKYVFHLQSLPLWTGLKSARYTISTSCGFDDSSPASASPDTGFVFRVLATSHGTGVQWTTLHETGKLRNCRKSDGPLSLTVPLGTAKIALEVDVLGDAFKGGVCPLWIDPAVSVAMPSEVGEVDLTRVPFLLRGHTLLNVETAKRAIHAMREIASSTSIDSGNIDSNILSHVTDTFDHAVALEVCHQYRRHRSLRRDRTIELRRPVSAGTDNDAHHLHICQLVVLDENGSQIPLAFDCASDAVAQGENGRGAEVAIDGDLTSYTHNAYSGGKWKSTYGKDDHFMRFSLQPTSTAVSKVIVYNRKGNCGRRLDGSVLTLEHRGIKKSFGIDSSGAKVKWNIPSILVPIALKKTSKGQNTCRKIRHGNLRLPLGRLLLDSDASLFDLQNGDLVEVRDDDDAVVWNPAVVKYGDDDGDDAFDEKSFEVGAHVEVLDNKNNWCKAIVISKDKFPIVRIHYEGWAAKFDEDLSLVKPKDKARICFELGRHLNVNADTSYLTKQRRSKWKNFTRPYRSNISLSDRTFNFLVEGGDYPDSTCFSSSPTSSAMSTTESFVRFEAFSSVAPEYTYFEAGMSRPVRMKKLKSEDTSSFLKRVGLACKMFEAAGCRGFHFKTTPGGDWECTLLRDSFLSLLSKVGQSTKDTRTSRARVATIGSEAQVYLRRRGGTGFVKDMFFSRTLRGPMTTQFVGKSKDGKWLQLLDGSWIRSSDVVVVDQCRPSSSAPSCTEEKTTETSDATSRSAVPNRVIPTSICGISTKETETSDASLDFQGAKPSICWEAESVVYMLVPVQNDEWPRICKRFHSILESRSATAGGSDGEVGQEWDIHTIVSALVTPRGLLWLMDDAKRWLDLMAKIFEHDANSFAAEIASEKLGASSSSSDDVSVVDDIAQMSDRIPLLHRPLFAILRKLLECNRDVSSPLLVQFIVLVLRHCTKLLEISAATGAKTPSPARSKRIATKLWNGSTCLSESSELCAASVMALSGLTFAPSGGTSLHGTEPSALVESFERLVASLNRTSTFWRGDESMAVDDKDSSIAPVAMISLLSSLGLNGGMLAKHFFRLSRRRQSVIASHMDDAKRVSSDSIVSDSVSSSKSPSSKESDTNEGIVSELKVKTFIAISGLLPQVSNADVIAGIITPSRHASSKALDLKDVESLCQFLKLQVKRKKRNENKKFVNFIASDCANGLRQHLLRFCVTRLRRYDSASAILLALERNEIPNKKDVDALKRIWKSVLSFEKDIGCEAKGSKFNADRACVLAQRAIKFVSFLQTKASRCLSIDQNVDKSISSKYLLFLICRYLCNDATISKDVLESVWFDATQRCQYRCFGMRMFLSLLPSPTRDGPDNTVYEARRHVHFARNLITSEGAVGSLQSALFALGQDDEKEHVRRQRKFEASRSFYNDQEKEAIRRRGILCSLQEGSFEKRTQLMRYWESAQKAMAFIIVASHSAVVEDEDEDEDTPLLEEDEEKGENDLSTTRRIEASDAKGSDEAIEKTSCAMSLASPVRLPLAHTARLLRVSLVSVRCSGGVMSLSGDVDCRILDRSGVLGALQRWIAPRISHLWRGDAHAQSIRSSALRVVRALLLQLDIFQRKSSQQDEARKSVFELALRELRFEVTRYVGASGKENRRKGEKRCFELLRLLYPITSTNGVELIAEPRNNTKLCLLFSHPYCSTRIRRRLCELWLSVVPLTPPKKIRGGEIQEHARAKIATLLGAVKGSVLCSARLRRVGSCDGGGASDDACFRSWLGRIGVNDISSAQEVNLYKKNGEVIRLGNSKIQANSEANIYVVSSSNDERVRWQWLDESEAEWKDYDEGVSKLMELAAESLSRYSEASLPEICRVSKSLHHAPSRGADVAIQWGKIAILSNVKLSDGCTTRSCDIDMGRLVEKDARTGECRVIRRLGPPGGSSRYLQLINSKQVTIEQRRKILKERNDRRRDTSSASASQVGSHDDFQERICAAESIRFIRVVMSDDFVKRDDGDNSVSGEHSMSSTREEWRECFGAELISRHEKLWTLLTKCENISTNDMYKNKDTVIDAIVALDVIGGFVNPLYIGGDVRVRRCESRFENAGAANCQSLQEQSESGTLLAFESDAKVVKATVGFNQNRRSETFVAQRLVATSGPPLSCTALKGVSTMVLAILERCLHMYEKRQSDVNGLLSDGLAFEESSIVRLKLPTSMLEKSLSTTCDAENITFSPPSKDDDGTFEADEGCLLLVSLLRTVLRVVDGWLRNPFGSVANIVRDRICENEALTRSLHLLSLRYSISNERSSLSKLIPLRSNYQGRLERTLLRLQKNIFTLVATSGEVKSEMDYPDTVSNSQIGNDRSSAPETDAQRSTRLKREGVLSDPPRIRENEFYKPFFDALQELGMEPGADEMRTTRSFEGARGGTMIGSSHARFRPSFVCDLVECLAENSKSHVSSPSSAFDRNSPALRRAVATISSTERQDSSERNLVSRISDALLGSSTDGGNGFGDGKGFGIANCGGGDDDDDGNDDETIEITNLRTPESFGFGLTNEAGRSDSNTFDVGDRVQVKFQGSWYKGTLVRYRSSARRPFVVQCDTDRKGCFTRCVLKEIKKLAGEDDDAIVSYDDDDDDHVYGEGGDEEGFVWQWRGMGSWNVYSDEHQVMLSSALGAGESTCRIETNNGASSYLVHVKEPLHQVNEQSGNKREVRRFGCAKVPRRSRVIGKDEMARAKEMLGRLIRDEVLDWHSKRSKLTNIMQQLGLQTSNLSNPDVLDEEACEKVRRQICRDSATIPTILELARSCSSESLIKHALRRLDERIVGTKNALFKAIAAKSGAPAFVVSCMRTFPTSRGVTHYALRCIIDLCQRNVVPQNVGDFQILEVFDLVVNILRPDSQWKDDHDMLGYAMGAVRGLIVGVPEHRLRFLGDKSGGIDDIGRILTKCLEPRKDSTNTKPGAALDVGDRVMATWKNRRERNFQDEYPATILGVNTSNGGASSHSATTTYNLIYDDNCRDKEVATSCVRPQTDSERKRHKVPKGRAEMIADQQRLGRLPRRHMGRPATAFGVTCMKCHELEKRTTNPPYYVGGSVVCDVCGLKDLEEKSSSFQHCPRCRYDVCEACSDQIDAYGPFPVESEIAMADRHNLFRWAVLLIATLSNEVPSADLSPLLPKIRLLNVSAKRVRHKDHPAVARLRSDAKFPSDVTIVVEETQKMLDAISSRKSDDDDDDDDDAGDDNDKNVVAMSGVDMQKREDEVCGERARESEDKESASTFAATSERKHCFCVKNLSKLRSFGARFFHDVDGRGDGGGLDRNAFYTGRGRYANADRGEWLDFGVADILDREVSESHLVADALVPATGNAVDAERLLNDFENEGDVKTLLRHVTALEETLAICHARRCVWRLLRLSFTLPEEDLAANLVKLSVARGCADLDVSGMAVESSSVVPFRPSVVSSSCDAFVRSLIGKEGGKDRLLDLCATNILEASKLHQYDNVRWDMRKLAAPDKIHLDNPSMEVARRIVSAVSACGAFRASERFCDALKQAAASPNIFLQFCALRIVRSIHSTCTNWSTLVRKIGMDVNSLECALIQLDSWESKQTMAEYRHPRVHSQFLQALFDILVVSLHSKSDVGTNSETNEAIRATERKSSSALSRVEISKPREHLLDIANDTLSVLDGGVSINSKIATAILACKHIVEVCNRHDDSTWDILRHFASVRLAGSAFQSAAYSKVVRYLRFSSSPSSLESAGDLRREDSIDVLTMRSFVNILMHRNVSKNLTRAILNMFTALFEVCHRVSDPKCARDAATVLEAAINHVDLQESLFCILRARGDSNVSSTSDDEGPTKRANIVPKVLWNGKRSGSATFARGDSAIVDSSALQQTEDAPSKSYEKEAKKLFSMLPSPENIKQLQNFGISHNRATHALLRTRNNLEMAGDFAFRIPENVPALTMPTLEEVKDALRQNNGNEKGVLDDILRKKIPRRRSKEDKRVEVTVERVLQRPSIQDIRLDKISVGSVVGAQCDSTGRWYEAVVTEQRNPFLSKSFQCDIRFSDGETLRGVPRRHLRSKRVAADDVLRATLRGRGESDGEYVFPFASFAESSGLCDIVRFASTSAVEPDEKERNRTLAWKSTGGWFLCKHASDSSTVSGGGKTEEDEAEVQDAIIPACNVECVVPLSNPFWIPSSPNTISLTCATKGRFAFELCRQGSLESSFDLSSANPFVLHSKVHLPSRRCSLIFSAAFGTASDVERREKDDGAPKRVRRPKHEVALICDVDRSGTFRVSARAFGNPIGHPWSLDSVKSKSCVLTIKRIDDGSFEMLLDEQVLFAHVPDEKDRPVGDVVRIGFKWRSQADITLSDVRVQHVSPNAILRALKDRQVSYSVRCAHDGSVRTVNEEQMRSSLYREREIYEGGECTHERPALQKCFPVDCRIEYSFGTSSANTRAGAKQGTWVRGTVLAHGSRQSSMPSRHFVSSSRRPPTEGMESPFSNVSAGYIVVAFEKPVLAVAAVPFACLGTNKIRIEKRRVLEINCREKSDSRVLVGDLLLALFGAIEAAKKAKTWGATIMPSLVRIALNFSSGPSPVRLRASKLLQFACRHVSCCEELANRKKLLGDIRSALTLLCVHDREFLGSVDGHDNHSRSLRICAKLFKEAADLAAGGDVDAMLFMLEPDSKKVRDIVLTALRQLEKSDLSDARDALASLSCRMVDDLSLDHFDSAFTFPGFELSNSARTLSVALDNEEKKSKLFNPWLTAYIGSRPLRSGMHYVEISIDATNHGLIDNGQGGCFNCGHIHLGVSGGLSRRQRSIFFGARDSSYLAPVNAHTRPFALVGRPSIDSYAYSTDQIRWKNGRQCSQLAKYGPRFGGIQRNHRLGMLIDLRRSPGRIIYFLDGVCYGVAFDDVKAPVRPFVCISTEAHKRAFGGGKCGQDVEGDTTSSKFESVSLVRSSAFSLRCLNTHAPIYAPKSVSHFAREVGDSLEGLRWLSQRGTGKPPCELLRRRWHALWHLWGRKKWTLFAASVASPKSEGDHYSVFVEIDRSHETFARAGDIPDCWKVGARIEVLESYRRDDQYGTRAKRTHRGTILGIVRNTVPTCVAYRVDGARIDRVSVISGHAENDVRLLESRRKDVGVASKIASSGDSSPSRASTDMSLTVTDSEELANMTLSEFDKALSDCDSADVLGELMKIAAAQSRRIGLSPFSMSPSVIVGEGDPKKRGPIWILLIFVNLALRNVLHWVDFNFYGDASALAYRMCSYRHLLFPSIKREFFNSLLRATDAIPRLAGDDNTFKFKELEVNRKEATAFWTQKSDLSCHDPVRLTKQRKHSLFGQFERGLSNFSPRELRQAALDNHVQDEQRRAFKVVFTSESVAEDDTGGQYRELFKELAKELMHPERPVLGLFCRGPKQRKMPSSSSSACLMVPNPSARDSDSMKSFETVGKLIGMAMRCDSMLLPLTLPRLWWKHCTGEPFDEEDVREFDDDDETHSVFALRSVDGERVVELVPHGMRTAVNIKAAYDPQLPANNSLGFFRSIALSFRQTEFLPQMQAMYAGLTQIVPAEALRLFTWRELQTEVSGEGDFDVQMLKGMTKYSGYTRDDATIGYFWSVLENDFSPRERTQFLEFTWAKTGLPSPKDMRRQFEITECLPTKKGQDPNRTLPVARTCFFQLSLPKYTSRESLKRNLLFAIQNSKGMEK